MADMKHIIMLIKEDRKGVIADIATKLGNEKINIESISASVMGKKGMVTLTVKAKDYRRAVHTLKKSGYNVMPSNMMILDLNDEPGVLSRVSSLLFENGINIESIHLITKHGNKALYALKVDKTALAKSVLGEYLFKEIL